LERGQWYLFHGSFYFAEGFAVGQLGVGNRERQPTGDE